MGITKRNNASSGTHSTKLAISNKKGNKKSGHKFKTGFKNVIHPVKTYANLKQNTSTKITDRKNQFIKDQVDTDSQSKEQLQSMLKIILFSVVAVIVLLALKLL